MSVSVIVAAAGRGQRMNEPINKQYLPLCGKPVLAHTITACLAARCFTHVIVIVTPGEELTFHRDVLLPWFPHEKITVAAGGKERQDSVRNGLAALEADTRFVCIHDGARPLAGPDLITNCLAAAQIYGAAIAAVPVKDTIKVVGRGGLVRQTPERETLWTVQTPQIFRRDWLDEVYERAGQDGFLATDDAGLLERYGYPVHVVKGSYDNIKITTPEDLMLAEALVRRR